jgi:hypothetical protein
MGHDSPTNRAWLALGGRSTLHPDPPLRYRAHLVTMIAISAYGKLSGATGGFPVYRASVILLFVVPATARADGGDPFPGIRTIWIDCTFTVDRDYPDYEFYLLPTRDDFPAERLPITPSNPVRVSGSGEQYRYVWCWIYVVPKSLLAPFGDSPPPRDWFSKTPGLRFRDGYSFRKAVVFTDNRKRAEITCRIEIGPDGDRIVQVSENAGDAWVKWAWIAAGVLLMVGVLSLGLWSLRRIRRRNPLSASPGGSRSDPGARRA